MRPQPANVIKRMVDNADSRLYLGPDCASPDTECLVQQHIHYRPYTRDDEPGAASGQQFLVA